MSIADAGAEPRPAAAPRGEVILKAENLVKHYPIKAGVLRRTVGWVQALDGVRVAVAELVGRVEVDDPHAHGLGEVRQ